MTFSYLKLHGTRRLFLIYYASGRSVSECLAELPGANGSPGVNPKTYEYWRSTDTLFVECMKNIDENPDWCHDNIVVPLLLAQDDLMMVLRAQGLKADPDRPWYGFSVKQRELMLNERGKLNREESVGDKFLAYMLRMEQNRERREKLTVSPAPALPPPTVVDGDIDSPPGQHKQET